MSSPVVVDSGPLIALAWGGLDLGCGCSLGRDISANYLPPYFFPESLGGVTPLPPLGGDNGRDCPFG